MSGTRLRGFALALVILTVLTRLPLLIHPRAVDDEAVYSVVADELVDGGQPYASAIERKPPGLFWVYRLIFGAGGKYNWPLLHIVSVVWVLLTMAAMYLTGKELVSPETGLVAALLYSIYVSWLVYRNLALNGEILMNLPIALSIWVSFGRSSSRFRPELLVAGALLGAAFLLKQPAALVAVPLGIYLLLPAYRASRSLSVAGSVGHATLLTSGFFGILAVVAVRLAHQGILKDAYFWTITNPGGDMPSGPLDPAFWIRAGLPTLAFVACCAPLLLGALASVAGRRTIWTQRRAEFVALIGLLSASAVMIVYGGRFYPHYYIPAVLPLALLAAPVGVQVLEGRRRPSRATALTWLGLTVVGFLIVQTVGLRGARKGSAAASYVRAHSAPADRMFVWGQAAPMYLDARRRPATRFINTFPLTGYIFGSRLSWDPMHSTVDRIVPGAWKLFWTDVGRHAPRYIVDTDAARAVAKYPIKSFPALYCFVAHRYRPAYRASDGVIYESARGSLSAPVSASDTTCAVESG